MSEPYRIVWSATALLDLEGILDHVAIETGPEAAGHVHDLLLAAIDRLTSIPGRCRVIPELRVVGVTEYRERIVRPYRICFRLHGRDLVLVAVLDGRRDLGEILVDRALRD